MNLFKMAKPKKLDMELVKSVLQGIGENDIRSKAAKIIQWDTQDKSPWLLAIADPYCESAGSANPGHVARVLMRCGYDAKTAVIRSAKRCDSAIQARKRERMAQ